MYILCTNNVQNTCIVCTKTLPLQCQTKQHQQLKITTMRYIYYLYEDMFEVSGGTVYSSRKKAEEAKKEMVEYCKRKKPEQTEIWERMKIGQMIIE